MKALGVEKEYPPPRSQNGQNGAAVNGAQVTTRMLTDGDEITFGSTLMLATQMSVQVVSPDGERMAVLTVKPYATEHLLGQIDIARAIDFNIAIDIDLIRRKISLDKRKSTVAVFNI